MKVVQINAVCGIGSTGRICVNLCDSLIAEGHECKILYGNGNSTYSHGVAISNKWLVALNALRARITGDDTGGCYISTWRIIKFLKQYKPDVVHLHNLHSHFVNLHLLCRYLAKNKIHTVITLHDCWLFTGKCSHYSKVRCEKWKKECGNCPQIKSDIPSWFFDKTKALLKKKRSAIQAISSLCIVGCSEWITKEARQSLKVNNFQTIHNGLNLNEYFPEESDFKNRHNCTQCELILGFANKWLMSNNHLFLRKFVDSLNAKQRLVIVGCSNKEIEYLTKISDRVIPIPRIKNIADLRKIYSACSLFVNLSKADTLPTVNLEAQACGVPVIAINKTGIPETICSKTGLVLDEILVKDIEDFVELLSKINYERIKEENIVFLKKNFDIINFFNKYTDIYRELIYK